MKSRASLVLMEQLIMILVFALTAALCLQVFVRADDISRETALQDQAVVLAQNGAETLKACQGDMAEAVRLLGGEAGGNKVTVQYEEMHMEMERTPAEIPGLGCAEIRIVETESGETLFSLTVAWQEVS